TPIEVAQHPARLRDAVRLRVVREVRGERVLERGAARRVGPPCDVEGTDPVVGRLGCAWRLGEVADQLLEYSRRVRRLARVEQAAAVQEEQLGPPAGAAAVLHPGTRRGQRRDVSAAAAIDGELAEEEEAVARLDASGGAVAELLCHDTLYLPWPVAAARGQAARERGDVLLRRRVRGCARESVG